MEQITTAQAIEQLVKALKEDSAYHDGWKANIAMAMYDEQQERVAGTSREAMSTIHVDISNRAADRFLQILINQ